MPGGGARRARIPADRWVSIRRTGTGSAAGALQGAGVPGRDEPVSSDEHPVQSGERPRFRRWRARGSKSTDGSVRLQRATALLLPLLLTPNLEMIISRSPAQATSGPVQY